MGRKINITLKIWRQASRDKTGNFKTYALEQIDQDASFVEMLDILNESLTLSGETPIAFESDCREGICGSCGAIVNGKAHGPKKETTLCQLHMRVFQNNDTIFIEPFRAKALPLIKDLVVDRSALDRIISAGGYVSVRTGSAPDANTLLIRKESAEKAMDAAECIGCAACIATCPNAAAMLFVSAKVTQLALLPQGHPERRERAQAMVQQMDKEGFGNCSNTYECEIACPKGISVAQIARLNQEFIQASLKES
ncbi:MAG: succinate dehydrogenase/fumarate reductase iron-sulfur subunit [Candidatus Margulisiibacteriota bacterium]